MIEQRDQLIDDDRPDRPALIAVLYSMFRLPAKISDMPERIRKKREQAAAWLRQQISKWDERKGEYE